MKQDGDNKRLGYFENVHRRGSTDDDDEYNKTYASELILTEKDGKTEKTTATREVTKVTATKSKEGKAISLTSCWVVGILVLLVGFSCSKVGRENIKRVITDCKKPASIPYGSIVVNEEEGTKYGAKASVVCSHGYTSSKPEVTCQENGKWSSVYCHVTDCGNTLPPIDNGQSTLNEEQDTTFGAIASVTCAPGHQPSKPNISCQANGIWEDAKCQPVDCGIPKIDHGHLIKDSTLFMSQATLKCDTGYAPSQSLITCTASGTWQHAECYNIDDCSNNPCQNGGQCLDKVADYECKCQRWYSGKNCEIDTRCSNHQCKYGGKCVGQPNGSYTCTCLKGFDGIFCERPH